MNRGRLKAWGPAGAPCFESCFQLLYGWRRDSGKTCSPGKELLMKKKMGLLFSLCLFLLLVSCGMWGNRQGQGDDGEDAAIVTEYSFRDSVSLDFLLSDSVIQGQMTDEGIYVGSCTYDAENRSLTQTIRYAAAADSDSGETSEYSLVSETALTMDLSGFPDWFGYASASWYVGAEGDIYVAVLLCQAPRMELGGIFRFSPEGTLLMESEVKGLPEQYHTVVSLAADSQKNIFLLAATGEMENRREELLLFQPDGTFSRKVDFEEGSPCDLLIGKDGCAYVAVESGQGGRSLHRLNGAGGIQETWHDFPAADRGEICPDTAVSFLYMDNSGVCSYDLRTGESQKLFFWLDYDILPDQVHWMASDGKGNFSAARITTQPYSLSLLRFQPGEDVSPSASSETLQEDPGRIVLGTLYEDTQLQKLVLNFNMSQSEYHVEVKSYLSSSGWDSEEYETQRERMNMDIATGRENFDLLSLKFGNRDAWNDLGILEDLFPYLETSKAFGREDFFEAVLAANTMDGKLVTIPRTFYMECLAGKESLLGDRTGWTLRELLDFGKEHPQARLFSSSSRSTVIYMILSNSTDQFITVEGGVPVFDEGLCADLLEMFQNCPDIPEPRPKSAPEMLQDEEALLAFVTLTDFDEIGRYEAFFNREPVTLTGFPTPDGKNGNIIQDSDVSTSGPFAILNTSEHKEGAWAFLEYALLEGSENGRYISGDGFPSLKEDFEREAARILEDQYDRDEEGNLILNKIGQPQLKKSGTYETDGWVYHYEPVEESDVELIRELLSRGAHLQQPMSEVFYQIFQEESEAYFNGQKKLEDAVEIMKNRMMLYYWENGER